MTRKSSGDSENKSPRVATGDGSTTATGSKPRRQRKGKKNDATPKSPTPDSRASRPKPPPPTVESTLEGDQEYIRPVRLLETGYAISEDVELRFTSYAWEKLLFMRDSMDGTEIGGLALSDTEDLLLVHDILIPKQEVTVASTTFDQTHLASLMAELADPEGEYQLPVDCFMRIWIHTHPCMSAHPSSRDMITFTSKEDFGSAPWGIMMILSDDGECYCRYRFNDVFGVSRSIDIPVTQTTGVDVPGIDDEVRAGWRAEIKENVEECYTMRIGKRGIPGKRQQADIGTSGINRSASLDYDTDLWGNADLDDWNARYRPATPTPPLPSPLDLATDLRLRRQSFFYMMDETLFLEMVKEGFFHEPMDIGDLSVACIDPAHNLSVCGVIVADNEIVDDGDEAGTGAGPVEIHTQFVVDPIRTNVAVTSQQLVEGRTFTSDELLDLDVLHVPDAAIRGELIDAEALLTPLAEERYAERIGKEILYDGFGRPIDFLTNWVTQLGDLLFITDDESDLLDDIIRGTLDASSLDFGCTGFNANDASTIKDGYDDVDLPTTWPDNDPAPDTHAAGPTIADNFVSAFIEVVEMDYANPPLAHMWNTVAQFVMDCIDMGSSTPEIETGLGKIRLVASREGKVGEFDRIATAIRNARYKVREIDIEDLLGEPSTAKSTPRGRKAV